MIVLVVLGALVVLGLGLLIRAAVRRSHEGGSDMKRVGDDSGPAGGNPMGTQAWMRGGDGGLGM